MEHILYFFIYSFFGWLCECLYCGIPARRFINRGFLEGPYCPIYGFGALIVLYILQPFADRIVLLFLAGFGFNQCAGVYNQLFDGEIIS